MLYLIGIGLNEKGISLEGLEAIKSCKKIYLENYTADLPYDKEKLEQQFGKKIISADRNFIEDMKDLINEAKKENAALLVYGSPLTATTHNTLIQEAKKEKVKYKIIYSGSVLDGVAECGLQLYKFGKITSIPHFDADSFIEVVKENQKINAHSLILIDIGLKFLDAIERLENVINKNNIKTEKIIVCSMLGTDNSKIYYNDISKLKNLKLEIKSPFCFIIPAKLHFMEEEFLENFREF